MCENKSSALHENVNFLGKIEIFFLYTMQSFQPNLISLSENLESKNVETANCI